MMRAIAALLLLACASIAPAQEPPRRVLVRPFENLTREGRYFWLTEASALLLTDDLV